MSFNTFVLREAYKRYQKIGDKLTEAEKLIGWKAFVHIIAGLFSNNTPLGGRPNYNGIMMLKMLVLQQWHGLTYQDLERQVTDRLSFMSFLGFPERIPDYSTVWLFRERLIKSEKMESVWNELQRQLDAKGLEPKKERGSWHKTRPSSLLTTTPASRQDREAALPSPGGAGTAPGQRSSIDRISGSSCMRRPTSITG